MPNFISEQQIENAIVEVFVQNLGYRHLNCEHHDGTGRGSETEVVLVPTLRHRLKLLNPGLPEVAIEEALRQLTQTRLAQSDMTANREVYQLLRDGVRVMVTNSKGKEEPATVRVIDFDQASRNDFLVVTQLWIQGQAIRRRPDVLVYVNGLPLVFIELKNSNVPLRSAYNDNLTNYRSDIPVLFHYNAACILSNGLETRVGSFDAGWEHFFLWLRETEKQEVDVERIRQYGVSLDYAVLGLCQPERLLDYVENFVLYYNEAVKICAKNHQFMGVNNAVANFQHRLHSDRSGTDTSNKGKLGVFWHTQGSGKSFSMIFFARKVFRKFTGNYTFLVVTDRDDLDGQIYRNFLGAGAFSKSEQCRPKNSEELREMLGTNRRYIFTLIQKFRYDKGKKYPLLSARNDIIVIVDEAHRTQYKDLAENMRTGLPNAQYIAFTGTPLLGSRKLTQDWFGETVSEYNFKQSIDDGATVRLYYHKRVPEVLLQNDDLDEDLADIVSDENLNTEQQERLEREFAREMSVLKADDRLETIAKDIVYHFPRRGYLGKGMVISVDKFTVVRMYDKVTRLWEEEKRKLQKEINVANDAVEKSRLKKTLDWMREVDMAVVVSEEAGEAEKFAKEGLDITTHRKRLQAVDENGRDTETRFKDPADPLQLVFVCSMWLTGFDAPTVSTLYLDKPMKDHSLMQTIARANRVTDYLVLGKPKLNGLIVDYYNVFRNLKKAFASYGGGSTEDKGEPGAPAREIDYLYVLLQEAIEACEGFCRTIGIDLGKILQSGQVFSKLDLFDQYADILLAKDERKQQFRVYDNTVDALYESCRPDILQRRGEFPLVPVIHYLREVLDGKTKPTDLDKAKRKISRLLDESIVADRELSTAAEPDQAYQIKAWRQIDLSKLDLEKLRIEYQQSTYKHIEIADLRAFIEDKMQQLLERNSTRTGFAQKLREIIDRYNSGGASTEDYFDDLLRFVEQLRSEEERHIREGLSEEELEMFDLLKKENLTQEEEQKVKLAARNLLKRLKEEKPTVLLHDWHKDTQTRLMVQSAIEKVLDRDLPPAYDPMTYNSKCKVVFEYFYLRAFEGERLGVA
ncbi:MAG: type I restriction endonuclease subunit R [Saprospiraceae bacterium]|nr:type I restriction endonuclease subunit R [Saprospiraceae bacterium]